MEKISQYREYFWNMFLKFQRFSASDIRIHFSTKTDVYLQLPPGFRPCWWINALNYLMSSSMRWENMRRMGSYRNNYPIVPIPIRVSVITKCPLPIRNRLKCWRFESDNSYKLVSHKKSVHSIYKNQYYYAGDSW